MIEDNKSYKISHIKRLEFDDILNFYSNKKDIITDDVFYRYGFTSDDVNWIRKNKHEMIYMNNEEVIKLTNKVVKNLKDENTELRKKLDNISYNNNTDTKNKLSIKKVDSETWAVTEYTNNNATGKKRKSTHTILDKHVNDIYKIINMLTDPMDSTTTYRQIASSIITKYNLDVDIEGFNGGKNRSKYLFPLYYYPLKILEDQGYILYSKGGIITLINFNYVVL